MSDTIDTAMLLLIYTISYIILHMLYITGDKRKFLSMVLSLKTNPDPETGAPTDVLAKVCICMFIS